MSVREVDFNKLPFRIRQYILKVASEFDLFPFFSMVYPSKLIERWGQIPWRGKTLPKKLTDPLKYAILVSLGYHGIIPRTEVLRQKLLDIADRFFKQEFGYKKISDYGHAYNSFIALNLFSQISVITLELLKGSESIRDDIRKALQYVVERLKKENILGEKSEYIKDPVTRVVFDYYSTLLDKKPVYYSKEEMETLKQLILSNLQWEEKFHRFLKYLKNIDQNFWKDCRNRGPRGFASSIHGIGLGIPWEKSSMGPNETAGESWSDMTKLLNQKILQNDLEGALSLAEGLDEMYKKQRKKEEGSNSSTKGSSESEGVPARGIGIGGRGYLGERRFISYVRKVRYYEVVLPTVKKELAKRKGKSPAGYTSWDPSEDVEKLDIEATLEDFGIIIPPEFSYKKYYIPGKRKKSGIGHITIIIDTSGSMSGLPLEYAIEGACALIEAARNVGDSVSLITFSGGPWLQVEPTYDYDYVIEFVSRLQADGGTEIFNALLLAEKHLVKQGGGGVFIFTDTYIWDIRKAAKAFEILNTYYGPVYIFSTSAMLYDELTDALKGSGVRVIPIGNWANCMEISLKEYLEL